MISPRVYRQFTEIVNNDFLQAHLSTSARSRGAHSVSRRLGLSSLPLAVLVLRVFGHAFLGSSTHALTSLPGPSALLAFVSYALTAEGALKGLILVLGLCVLTAFKLLLTITLVGRISVQALHDRQMQVVEEESSEQPTEKERQPDELDALADTKDVHMDAAGALLRVPSKRDEAVPLLGGLRLKKEEGESDSGRRGRLADVLTIDTSYLSARNRHVAAALDMPMPSLEVAPTAATDSTPMASSSGDPAALSESSSLSASPCVSPTSSSAQYPVQHEGDMLPAHDRVGSVELVKPSQELYTHLLTVDRYALTDKHIPP